jgi:presqualene diphosphate synthase
MSAATNADPPKQAAASGSSFYAAMRVLPRPRREAMLAIYGFCRAVDDVADEPDLSSDARLQELDGWCRDLASLYAGGAAGRAADLAHAVAEFDLQLEDFIAVVAGMEMDVVERICAPTSETLDLYCDRVASAVGRLSVNVFGLDRTLGVGLAHHLGRALQLTNILRDLDEDAAIGRLYLPREALVRAGVPTTTPAEALAHPRLGAVCSEVAATARNHFVEAAGIMNVSPRSAVRAPRMMAEVYEAVLDRLLARGWTAPRPRVRTPKSRVILALLRHGIL